MTPLPVHRVLQGSSLDPKNDPAEFFDTAHVAQDDPELYLSQDEIREQRYESVTEAICAGKRLVCYSNEADIGLREVCMTQFTDPETREQRYAVEVWHGKREGKHDFADLDRARKRMERYRTMLERSGKLTLKPV